MKSNQQFILDTLLPYKENPLTCATNSKGGCEYLTEDGKKCAVGKHMKEGEWQKYGKFYPNLCKEWDKEKIFTKKAFQQNLSDEVWQSMQEYHDTLARGIADEIDKENINKIVSDLETFTKSNLTELKF